MWSEGGLIYDSRFAFGDFLSQVGIMPLLINIQLVRQKPLQVIGEIPVVEIAEGFRDDLIRFATPLHYELEVRLEGEELFAQGTLRAELECECSRCLKTFRLPLEIPDFSALAPLSGEEAVPMEGDFANLTPLLREDSLLALPTAPLCKPDCRGLAVKAPARDSRSRDTGSAASTAGKSPWDALEQLKLK